MAEVTVVPEKVETIVSEAGYVSVKLTNEEAQALRTLLYTGVGHGTLVSLGLTDLSAALRGQEIDYDNPRWYTNANLDSVVNPR